MKQPKKSLNEIRDIVGEIDFKDREFLVKPMGDGFYLQMIYWETDIESNTDVPMLQSTRKWYISPFATTSEIVQTALKCVITSQEHIAREYFLYKGERIFGPHHDVEQLVHQAKMGGLKQERRNPK